MNKSQDITNLRPNASTLDEQIRIENKQIEVIIWKKQDAFQ